MQNKFLILSFTILSFTITTNIAYASHEEKEHHEIKISDEAIQNYGIKTIKLEKSQKITLPRSAFVASKDHHYLYSVDEHGGYIEIEPHFLQATENDFTFLNEDNNQEFVIEGAKYLRMISLSQDTPITGHSH